MKKTVRLFTSLLLCALLLSALSTAAFASGSIDYAAHGSVTVTAADGTAIIYQPFLSLRDGSLAVPEDGTVYDFTVYPEGFVRETTA